MPEIARVLDLACNRRSPLDLRPHLARCRAQGPRPFRRILRDFSKGMRGFVRVCRIEDSKVNALSPAIGVRGLETTPSEGAEGRPFLSRAVPCRVVSCRCRVSSRRPRRAGGVSPLSRTPRPIADRGLTPPARPARVAPACASDRSTRRDLETCRSVRPVRAAVSRSTFTGDLPPGAVSCNFKCGSKPIRGADRGDS